MPVDNTTEHDQSNLVRSYSVLTGIHLIFRAGIIHQRDCQKHRRSWPEKFDQNSQYFTEHLKQTWYICMTADNTADHDLSSQARNRSVLIGIYQNISNKYGTPARLLTEL